MNLTDGRLEQVLANIAGRYAQELIPPGWRPGTYPLPNGELATSLAGYNVLVMTGSPPENVAGGAAVKAWVESYVRLYDLLAGALFPSFTRISAYFADNQYPPIVFLYGTATPVIIVLAGYIAPYLASRQRLRGVSDFELLGLMNIVLDELEAGDLPYDRQRKLRDDGVALLRQMLASPVRQRRLTEPKRALQSAFDLDAGGTSGIQTPVSEPTVLMPPAAPETQPELPDDLPEANALAQPGVTGNTPNPFESSIPIFFEAKSRGVRKPPIPDLPDGKE